MKARGHIIFELCFSEPHGNQCIAFEITLHWRSPEIFYTAGQQADGGAAQNTLCLKAESQLVDEDWNQGVLFRVRDAGNQLTLRRGRHQFRSRILGGGSGGNWHWECYTLPLPRSLHLLNWLRRIPNLDLTEWDGEFVDRVWRKRGTIVRDDLKQFLRSCCHSARQADSLPK